MTARIKAALQLMRKYVWVALLGMFPYADQIIAAAEAQLPTLAPYLGQNTFKWMGLAIVAAKVALQGYRLFVQLKAMLLRAKALDAGEVGHG